MGATGQICYAWLLTAPSGWGVAAGRLLAGDRREGKHWAAWEETWRSFEEESGRQHRPGHASQSVHASWYLYMHRVVCMYVCMYTA